MRSPENFPNVVLAAGGAWHERELLRHGYTPESLAKARRGFSIVSWKDRFGGWHYPRWQFDPQMKVLPSIVKIVRLFRSSDSLYVMSQFLCPVASKKTLLELIRSGHGDKAVSLAEEVVREYRAEPKMTGRDLAELKRRLHEHDDPVRYIVVSSLLRGWAMVYDVANNVYCHEHVSEGCVIKDRKLAQAIAMQLRDNRSRPSDLHVLPIVKTKYGFRATEDIPGRKGQKPWRPRFRTPDDTSTFVPITIPDTREFFVDAMLFAAEHRDVIVRLVSGCADRSIASKLLVQKCQYTPRQAQAVLDMRIHSFTSKSVAALVDELRKSQALQS